MKYDDVRKIVLPLFEKAREVLSEWLNESEDRNLVCQFIENNERRKENIRENFLKGKRSSLMPGDEVSGQKREGA